MEKRFLTHNDCFHAATLLAKELREIAGPDKDICLHAVPRGGIPAAYLVSAADPKISVFNHKEALYADFKGARFVAIVDDLMDSGATKERYGDHFPDIHFFSLADFLHNKKGKGEWLVFPWEVGEDQTDTSADDIVTRLLQYIGEDPTREGLRETPQRVLKAWKHWTKGYGQDPMAEMKVFQDGGELYSQMVVRREIPFHSHCEHHLAPFFGTATVAYIPNGKVLGLSKVDRVVDIFARRLQVQERLTCQIAEALEEGLKPKGVGVVIKARHLCVESRGVEKHTSETVTSELRGEFLNKPEVRAEFLALAR